MAIKSVSIRIEEEMLEKLGYVADYEGRSVNSHILVLIRENIKAFEQEHGEIDGTINPAVNYQSSSQCEAHQEKLRGRGSGYAVSSVFATKAIPERTNQTQGSATPLPHILYSAASE